jgi:undecaprenyl-diphosphatase
VEDAGEHAKLWSVAAMAMAATGGLRGRRAAAAGPTVMAVAEVLSNAVAKRLYERRRPPPECIGPEVSRTAPTAPPSHTAAAVAFTAAIAPPWRAAGAACAVPAVMVAVERVHTGAHYPQRHRCRGRHGPGRSRPGGPVPRQAAGRRDGGAADRAHEPRGRLSADHLPW